jgi:hypothetical protein
VIVAVPVVASGVEGGRTAAAGAPATGAATDVEATLRLAPEVHFLLLAGRPVLFARAAEAVFELHGDASRLAGLLEGGARPSDLVSLVTKSGWPPEEAREIVADLLGDWSRRGLLRMDRPHPAECSAAHEIAGTRFRVSSASPSALGEARLVFREAPDDEALPSYSLLPLLGRVAVRSPSGQVVIATQEEAVPELKSAVIADLLQGCGCMALHAACLVSKGEAILLTGSPGAGKSTLAAALSRAGFDYAADDITLVSDGEALGVCAALTLKEGAQDLLGSAGGGDEPLPFRRRDGVRLAYEWPASIAPAGSFPVRAIVRLDRCPEGDAALTSLDALGALRDLLAEAFSARGSASLAELRMLDRIVAGARLFQIRYSRLADAVALLGDQFL